MKKQSNLSRLLDYAGSYKILTYLSWVLSAASALLALVPIWLYRGRQGCHSKPFQYACYAFYPMHMLLLVLVLNFVNR